MNTPEYVWIYNNRHGSEHVSNNTQCAVTVQVNEYILRDGGRIQDRQRFNTQRFGKIIIAFNSFRKPFNLKSLRVFWLFVGFQVCQGSENSRIVNVPGFWISRVTQGFNYYCKFDRVLNMCRNVIIEGSEYSRNPNMPGFCICKRYTRFWTCLNMAE